MSQVTSLVYHLVIGPNGSGKGTQIPKLSTLLGVPGVSTGDAFRALSRKGGDLGRQVADVMNAGGLVSDELTLQVLKSRLQQDDCKNGAILDGFPRNLAQLDLLIAFLDESNATPGYVFVFNLSDEEVVSRISGRRVCTNSSCGATYHILHHTPVEQGICDKCGSNLAQRPDDKEDVVWTRLRVYHAVTEPVLQELSQWCIVNIDARQSIDEVYAQITSAISIS